MIIWERRVEKGGGNAKQMDNRRKVRRTIKERKLIILVMFCGLMKDTLHHFDSLSKATRAWFKIKCRILGVQTRLIFQTNMMILIVKLLPHRLPQMTH